METNVALTSATWVESTLTCNLVSRVDIEILTAKVGFSGNLHNYVVSGRKRGITE